MKLRTVLASLSAALAVIASTSVGYYLWSIDNALREKITSAEAYSSIACITGVSAVQEYAQNPKMGPGAYFLAINNQKSGFDEIKTQVLNALRAAGWASDVTATSAPSRGYPGRSAVVYTFNLTTKAQAALMQQDKALVEAIRLDPSKANWATNFSEVDNPRKPKVCLEVSRGSTVVSFPGKPLWSRTADSYTYYTTHVAPWVTPDAAKLLGIVPEGTVATSPGPMTRLHEYPL